jgi:hypothetical protein
MRRRRRVGDTRRLFNVARSDMTRPQQDRRGAGRIDDRRLDADVAFAAVEHEVDCVAELAPHMLGERRADAAEPVGGRRGDAAAEFFEQCMRDGMRRNTQAHGVLPAGDGVADARRTL